MKKPRYSAIAWSACDAFLLPWKKLHVDSVRISGLEHIRETDDSRPLLVCPNHVGWWDGFLIREIHRRTRPKAPLYTVMLERELKHRPYLRYLGALGLEPGSVGSVLALLRTVRDITRTSPNAVIVLFPQGRIYPSYRRPLGFLPGVRAVADAIESPASAVPVSIHMEPGNTPSPTAYLHVGSAIPSTHVEPTDLEARVEAGIDRIHSFLSMFGEDAPDLWGRSPEAPAPPDATTHPTH